MEYTINLYLNIVKKTLLDTIYLDPDEMVTTKFGEILRLGDARATGLDWPERAHTMIGRKRLDSLGECVITVLRDGIPGDLIETGVWRGGASIFMRAILKAYQDSTRKVWVADSFQGCPPPNTEKYPQDEGLELHMHEELAISRAEVENNFQRYELLDHQVKFLEGWFKNTLPDSPIDQLAVMRLDGDLYESTMDALTYLYPKLSAGGFAIIDDYGAIPACRLAVTDFRTQQGIREPIHEIDWTGVHWRKA